jgi:hypothetical protein
MTESLDFRKDTRSTETFIQNISDFTQREQIYGEALRRDIAERLNVDVGLRSHGVDNTGGFISDALGNHNVDMCFLIKGKEKYFEIKTAPEYLDSFYTFKVFSLRQAIEQKAGVALTKLNYYYIFGASALEWMLENLKHSIYPRFSPNDTAVRIYASQVNDLYNSKMLMFRNWTPKAKHFIEQHRTLLLKEKAT